MAGTLAFHYLGCASVRDGALHVPGRVGALIECFAERSSEVVVLAYDQLGSTALEDRADYPIEAPNVGFVSLGPKGSLRDVFARRRRARAVVRAHCASWDAVVLKLPNRRVGSLVRALRGSHLVPIVVGHTPSVVATASWPLWRKAFVLTFAFVAERAYRRILRAAAITYVNSLELRDRYASSANRIELITLSSRRARFAHDASDRMGGPHVELLVSGRITAEKGVFEAMDAFAELRTTDLPNARLHIVGDGPDLPRLLERAVGLGVSDAVLSHGWTPVGERLFSIYRGMDVLLLPSYAEGLPYAVWEAMAHSVLVVCTPVGGLREALTHGEDALLVAVKDAHAVADAVRRLYHEPDLRRALLAAGYARAAGTDLDTAAERILAGVTAP